MLRKKESREKKNKTCNWSSSSKSFIGEKEWDLPGCAWFQKQTTFARQALRELTRGRVRLTVGFPNFTLGKLCIIDANHDASLQTNGGMHKQSNTRK